MKLPLILNESPNADVSGDLSVYGSVEAVQAYHEAYDAEDPAFQLYDSDGRLLKARPDWKTGGTLVELDEETPSNPARLEAILRDYLARRGSPPELLNRPVAEMIAYIYQTESKPT